MQIVILFVLFTILSIFFNYISYIDSFRKGFYYLGATIVLYIIFAYIWFNMQKLVESKETMLFLVITWDLIVIATGVITPIIFFDVKITKLAYLGIVFVIAGIILLKLTLLNH